MTKSFHSIRVTDVGSFPLTGVDLDHYMAGAIEIENGKWSTAADYFVEKHNEFFLSKFQALGSAHSVPCYVQSSYKRDMLSQFLDPVVRKGTGLQKRGDNYFWDGGNIQLPSQEAQIAELMALKAGAKAICAQLDIETITYRACITGPFEMMTRLWRNMGVSIRYDMHLIESFSKITQDYMRNAFIQTKYLKPAVLTLDEPSIGVTGIEDMFIDSESDSSLSHLIDSWNLIYNDVPKGCYKGIHLHSSPYRHLARAQWNLLEAHTGVIVSKEWLVENDKNIKAPILRTDGPSIPANVDLKTAWQQIFAGDFDAYLQSKAEMKYNLKRCIAHYGIDRIPFAGPECGLGAWNWKYGAEMALANLRRVREVVEEFV